METQIERRVGKAHRGEVWVVCPLCKVERWLRVDSTQRKRFTGCCRKCSTKYHLIQRGGSHSPTWKGGRYKQDGYFAVQLAKDDFFISMASARGVVREHRLIMAKHLNRCLLPWEIVHHKNGIKDDNRIENLQLLPGGNYHLVDTTTKALIKTLEKTNRKQSEIIEKQARMIEELKEHLWQDTYRGSNPNLA